jgi:hypothetical protein
MVVWQNDKDTVYSSRFTPAKGWSLTMPFNVARMEEPRIGIDGSGDAVALARSSAISGHDLYANRYGLHYTLPNLKGTLKWGSPVLVENGSDAVGNTDLAVSPSGDAVAVWAQSGQIHANIYTY